MERNQTRRSEAEKARSETEDERASEGQVFLLTMNSEVRSKSTDQYHFITKLRLERSEAEQAR